METLVLRKPDAAKSVGLSVRQIDLLIKKGDFPSPIHLAGRVAGWSIESLREWVRARPEVSNK